MLFAPLEGWRHVEVTDRHAAVDYAHLLKDVSDRWYPNAAKIALVQDNLSTHKPARSMRLFRPPRRAGWWNGSNGATQKHGSWLNMAETELSVLSSQCLDRRIATQQRFDRRGGRLGSGPEQASSKADWQFATEARTKLKRLYPSI